MPLSNPWRHRSGPLEDEIRWAPHKDLATALQFGSSIGVLHRLRSTRWLIGVRLTHYSNAGIKQPNPGQDYFQLWTSYVFP